MDDAQVERPVTAPAKPNAQRPSWLPAAALGTLAVLFFVLWLGARSEANDANQELGRLQAIEDDRQAAEEALPDLEALADEHLDSEVIQDSSETALSLNFQRVDTSPLEALLDELGFSSAIMGRIGNTRALDGTLTADAPHATATWTYHPDDGLSIVIERTN